MNNPDHLKDCHDDDSVLVELPGCAVELMRDGGSWPKDLACLGELVAKAVEIALDVVGSQTATNPKIKNLKPSPHINILLSSDDNIKHINLEFRGIDKATNVLSFPVGDDRVFGPAAGTVLGDIILGYETVTLEAKERDIPLNNHIIHLVVHGVLHLIGFDHQYDNEATLMEGLETRILSKLGICDPYASDLIADHASPDIERGVKSCQ